MLLLGLGDNAYSQGLFEGGVHAQEGATDGFFKSTYTEYREDVDEWGAMPMLPGQHGYSYDYAASAPLGSGLVLLATFGVGYLALRKKD